MGRPSLQLIAFVGHTRAPDPFYLHVGRSADDETRVDLRGPRRGKGPIEGMVILDDRTVFGVRCR